MILAFVCALAQKNLGLESLFPLIKQTKMALTKRDEGSAKEPTPEGLAPFLTISRKSDR